MKDYVLLKSETLKPQLIAGQESVTPDIKIMPSTKISNTVTQCIQRLQNHQRIVLFGKGSAINKTISIAELVKRNSGLGEVGQVTDIGSVRTVDVWKSTLDPPLDDVCVDRNLPFIQIVLTVTTHTS